MNKRHLRNSIVNAFSGDRLTVVWKKLWARFRDESGSLTEAANLEWLRENRTDFEMFARERSEELWEETEIWAREMRKRADRVLHDVPPGVGGGGAYPFLYFLTRYLRPSHVVETGVAAGFSSQAFLSAFRRNGQGELWSSDFPYLRLRDPEQYIGMMVEEDLKENWHLYLDGDDINLPRIIDRVPEIDLFHYDSDKWYRGRRRAMEVVAPHMSPRGVVVMDDLQNNSFFYDCVAGVPSHWDVFGFGGKYVGVIWTSLSSRRLPE